MNNFIARINLAIDSLIALGEYDSSEIPAIRVQAPKPFIRSDLRRLYTLIGMVDRLQSVGNRGLNVEKLQDYLMHNIEGLIREIDLQIED